MKSNSIKQIEVLVKPNSPSMRYYSVSWRIKKKFNVFNFWKKMTKVVNGVNLDPSHTILFVNFDDAVTYGKKLVDNPKLIVEHFEKQKMLYKQAQEQRNLRLKTRNKTIKL